MIRFALASFILFTIALPAHALTRVVLGIPTRLSSLDPYSLTGIDGYQVTALVLEPLARLHPKTRELVPCLAKSWSVDTKRRRVRVHLKENVRFHNGKVMTADDVKFTFESFFRPEYKAAMWQPMFDDVKRVHVLNASTVEVEFKRLRFLGYRNWLTSLRILPRSFYEPARLERFRQKIVGTGPFRLEEFEALSVMRLVPNPSWHGGDPPAFAVAVKLVNEARMAEQMLDKGELDFYALPSSVDSSFESSPYMVRSSSGLGEGLWLDLNLKRALFQSRNVRRALLMLWDRERLNRKLYRGDLKLALDVFSPKMDYYPPGKPEAFDRDQAARVLANEGWKDEDHNSVLEKDGNEFRFTVLVKDSATERWISLYQADAAQVGVRVEVQRLEEDSQWWQRLKDGRFDAVAGSGGVSESAHASTWRSDGFYNFLHYSNPDVDSLIDQLETEFDLKKRRTQERELLARIRSDLPAVPGLYSGTEKVLVSRRLLVDTVNPWWVWKWRLKDLRFH